MSPFDYVKSITTSKVDLYTVSDIFEKEYNAFIVNRALSNSPQTVLFADALNVYPNLDKKIQYDFYRIGIPKGTKYLGWTKKEDSSIENDLITFVCEEMNLSQARAIEYIELIGLDRMKDIFSSIYGGKSNAKRTTTAQ